ncbi:MAG TPA: hypothetical protein PK890_11340, partial [Terrimesophilobacter sp.]|nr:hypothetical protein [Terrimesophilobacter sp.]
EEVRRAAEGRPVRVLCASGVRSAIAHRVLVQNGFDSASLSGGTLTLRAHLGARADAVLTTAGRQQNGGGAFADAGGATIPAAGVGQREASSV